MGLNIHSEPGTRRALDKRVRKFICSCLTASNGEEIEASSPLVAARVFQSKHRIPSGWEVVVIEKFVFTTADTPPAVHEARPTRG
jgi:hypothetical protein